MSRIPASPRSADKGRLVLADLRHSVGAACRHARRELVESAGTFQDSSPAGCENCWAFSLMRKLTKPSPTVSPLLFELDPEPLQETLTALGGIPLVVQAFRSLGLPQRIQEHVRVKQRQRGYDEATFVESFVILNAAGGEWVEDFERLRQDPGLAEMIGQGLPSPRAALEFLQAFHQEEKIEEAKQQRLPEQIAYIPDETPAQEGLGRVNGDLVRRFGERTPDQRIATVDQDATIIESHKQQALTT